MNGRPEVLFPLFSDVTTLAGIGPRTARFLATMGITRPVDLLYTLPHSGVDRRRRESVRDVILPAVVTVAVTVGRHQPPRDRRKPYWITVDDGAFAFQIAFFHAKADYLQKLLPFGQRRVVSGRVELFDGVARMVHPDHVVREDEAASIPDFEPVYPLTAGLTQKTMWKATRTALDLLLEIDEWADLPLVRREGWPSWADAMRLVHAPATSLALSPNDAARQRLAYDEVFAHQVTLALARAATRRTKGRATRADGALRQRAISALPYRPTPAQERAVAEIEADMAAPERMNRLLQGDVGSGKTLVAFLAVLIAVEAGGQAVMMAPTEILARQHYEGLRDLARQVGVRMELLTGRDKGSERDSKLLALRRGEIAVLIGTHAVFQRDVTFSDLRLAVVDEQHRFGVAQRMELGDKGDRVDVLVMTATPIPRSLALAQYGDMDLSVLDEKPPGRTPVATALVPMTRLDEMVDHLRRAVKEGLQAYWVCPLVEESETSDLTAAQERFSRLRAQLGEDAVGLVHGQMAPVDKDLAMARFVAGQTKVLVATTVIEVGVNVPNATIMVIERAETFGLAQLHQLRGRVGRGFARSACTLLYQSPLNEAARRRLEILRDTEDGFRIAEEDLLMRGAGDVIGTAQSGLPRFRIADLERQAGLMQLAQQDARKLLQDDPGLTSERGRAVRVLLWLLEQDRAFRMIGVG
jgi:ATP-dependent DNA helicase RecG